MENAKIPWSMSRHVSASDRPWFQLDCWILQFYSIVAEQAVNNQSWCNQLKCFVDWTATFYFSCIWFHPAPDISNDINFHFRRCIIEFKYDHKILLSKRIFQNEDTKSEKPWFLSTWTICSLHAHCKLMFIRDYIRINQNLSVFHLFRHWIKTFHNLWIILVMNTSPSCKDLIWL